MWLQASLNLWVGRRSSSTPMREVEVEVEEEVEVEVGP
jgi:hypothetical protein